MDGRGERGIFKGCDWGFWVRFFRGWGDEGVMTRAFGHNGGMKKHSGRLPDAGVALGFSAEEIGVMKIDVTAASAIVLGSAPCAR